MKAVVYDRPGQFEVRDLPDPEPGPRDVLLRVLMTGVCGTELHLHAGEFGPRYPLVPGHEIVGEVIELGPEATQLRLGQRVVLDNTTSCGACVECRRARPAFCRHLIAQGVTAPGGFAERLVAAEDRCFPVDDLPVETAVFAEPTACVVHGLDVLGLKPVADVLLFGAGPTGLLLTQLLARSCAGSLTVAEVVQTRLDLAAARGADHAILVDRGDPAATQRRLREIAPDGFDVVIDATGTLGVLEGAIALTRTGGTIFAYGMTPEAARWQVPSYEIFRRELTIKGSFAQQFSFDRALEALRTGRIDTTGMVTHQFGLERYGEALAAVADGSCIKAVVTPQPA